MLAPALLLSSCGGGDGTDRAPPQTVERNNVIVIVADDLGYGDLGVQRSADVRTPRIDALAAEGARLSDGYVSAPVCSPTRAGLITGRYPQRFGLDANPPNPSPPEFGLPLEEYTLAEVLRDGGYATGLVGKWHLGTAPQFHPMNRGFDEFFGFLGGSHSYREWGSSEDPVLRGFEPVDESTYLTDAFTREAVSFVRRHADEPFLLVVAYSAVHRPMEKPPRKYMDRFPDVEDPLRRKLLAMLAAMDDGVGAVLDAVESAGLSEETLVVFLSDNGAPTDLNGSLNAPLRGGKEQLLEGGIRVPFIVRWPGRVPAGLEYGGAAIQLDVFSTALAAAGVPQPADREIDGVDLVPLLRSAGGSAQPHAALFWTYGDSVAVRKGDWKLLRRGVNPPRLFDLSGDVGETTDLAASRPDVVSELEAELGDWRARVEDAR